MGLLNNDEKDNRIVTKKCIYCKKNVNTCNEKPVCSRKECKKKRLK